MTRNKRLAAKIVDALFASSCNRSKTRLQRVEVGWRNNVISHEWTANEAEQVVLQILETADARLRRKRA